MVFMIIPQTRMASNILQIWGISLGLPATGRESLTPWSRKDLGKYQRKSFMVFNSGFHSGYHS